MTRHSLPLESSAASKPTSVLRFITIWLYQSTFVFVLACIGFLGLHWYG